MEEYFEQQCDIIDASVFTGDILFDKNVRKRFREYLIRWKKATDDWEEVSISMEKDLLDK
jgi:hypothetical protein